MKGPSLTLANKGHQPRDALGGAAQLSSDGLSLAEEEPFHHFPGKGCSGASLLQRMLPFVIIPTGTPALTGRWALSPHKASFLSVDAILFVGELPTRLLTPRCSRTEPLKWSVIMVNNRASKEGKESGGKKSYGSEERRP